MGSRGESRLDCHETSRTLKSMHGKQSMGPDWASTYCMLAYVGAIYMSWVLAGRKVEQWDAGSGTLVVGTGRGG